ncbi:MAG: HAD-IA family hydrolase [Planctomycetota bacterium]|nr:HAD-IA family hydrolase [Planctomycetota bacterium]
MNLPKALLDVVFFDLDDTLYSTTSFAENARRRSVRAMIDAGLQVDFETGVTELNEVVAEFSSNYPSHFGRLLDRLGPDAVGLNNPAVLVAAGVVAYHDSKEAGLVMLEDAQAVLQHLSEAGIRIGVISAGLQVKQAEKLIRIEALPYLDPTAIFFSDQVGVSKPNPKIYTKACEFVGVAPERALYVGDRPSHDAAPARVAGMQTVHYTGAGGKYGGESDGGAHHVLDDLRDLIPILREKYRLAV